MNAGQSTVLIFRIGSLGDTVVALPCFHRIARSFPDSHRILVTDTSTSQKVAPVQSVLGDTGLIHEVIYFPPPPRKLRDVLTLRRTVRETGARTLIYVADRNLAGTLRDVLFFRTCGIRDVIGAPVASDLRRLRRDPKSGRTEHEAERLARCLLSLGPIDLEDPAMWDLQLKVDELRIADYALGPLHHHCFFTVSLGGKDRAKDWGNDNWSVLLEMVAARYQNLGLVFIGSADEFDRCAAVGSQWSGPILNLCGKLTPRESAAVMRRAMFYLGHDCGPMHLAAAVGIPCIAMFGPVNMPKWWHPMGSMHRIFHNMRGVSEISPNEVCEAVRTALAIISNQAYPNLDPAQKIGMRCVQSLEDL